MMAVDYPTVGTKIVVAPKYVEFSRGGHMDSYYINRYKGVGEFMGVLTREWFHLYFIKYDIPILWLIKNKNGTIGIYHKSEIFDLEQ